MNTKLFGTVVAATATKGGTPAIRLSLYTGKNQDGSYKESTMVDLVGKALNGLAVKDRVLAEVSHMDESVFTRSNGEKGVSLKAVAFSAEKVDKGEAITVRGNLVADTEESPNGKPKFRIGVNFKDKDGAKSAFYSVLSAKGEGAGMAKGTFVEVSGLLVLSVGKKNDRVFRDIIAFNVDKVEKASASTADDLPAYDDSDDDLPF